MAQEARTYLTWGDSPQDDITSLPGTWEARVAHDNRVFFVDHSDKRTQWDHPVTKQRYKVPPGLPYGWQKFKDDEDTLVFVDHLDQLRSFMDPRLLNRASYDFADQFGIHPHTTIKSTFRSLLKAKEVLKNVGLSNKVAIVTGANSGLGYQTALSLAERGAHVILACRDPVKADDAVRRILQSVLGAKVEAMQLDLSSLRSVRSFAEEFTSKALPLHILVLNAGVFGGPFTLTVDGLERHFAVNHIGHFYLAKLLVDVMKNSKPSRVVIVSSESHCYPSYTSPRLNFQILRHPTRENYSAITAYGASKLCNLLFMIEFHRRYSESGVSCNAVHPGNMLPTNLSRNASCMYRAAFTAARLFTRSVEQGASITVYCAAHPSMEGVSGLYMYDFWPAEPSHEAQSISTAAALWSLSEQIVEERIAVDAWQQ